MTYTLDPPLPRTATPADYTRLHFDPANVPHPRIVGLLACQRDPLLQSLTSRVCTATRAALAPLAQKGRQKKAKGGGGGGDSSGSGATSAATSVAPSAAVSGATTPLQPAGTLWEVELDDTVLFPEGGGQPWDVGVMEVELAANGESEANGEANGNGHTKGAPTSYPIEGCIRRGLSAIHLIRAPADADLAALIGANVTVSVDWARRTDHMITHTAQHLLSAVLDARGLPTLSWAMDPFPGDGAYVELPRGLTWAEAEEVERECNAYIGKNLRVWIDVSQQDPGEGEGEGNAEERERESRGVPKDYTGGVIRHCNIDGIDRNACCGTQCPSLSFVGFIHVLPPPTPFAAAAPSSSAPTRLYFYAGPRAAAHLATASRTLSRAAQVLSVPRAQLPERVGRLENNRFDTADANKALRLELARVLSDAPECVGHVAWVLRTSGATHDFEFMNAVASGFFARLGEDEVAEGRDEDKAAAMVIVSAPTNVSPALVLVQGRDAAKAKALYEEIKVALGDRVKGGGAKGRFMAKVEKWGGRDTLAVKKILASD